MEYYNINKINILNQQKVYRELNKEYRNNQKKEYRELNKDVIKEKKGEIFQCDCGSTYTKQHKQRHYRTRKHNNGNYTI